MIHFDEIELTRRILGGESAWHGIDAMAIQGHSRERLFGVLEKWTDRGWWDYGVSVRTGWLTDAGRVALATRLALPRPFSRKRAFDPGHVGTSPVFVLPCPMCRTEKLGGEWKTMGGLCDRCWSGMRAPRVGKRAEIDATIAQLRRVMGGIAAIESLPERIAAAHLAHDLCHWPLWWMRSGSRQRTWAERRREVRALRAQAAAAHWEAYGTATTAQRKAADRIRHGAGASGGQLAALLSEQAR